MLEPGQPIKHRRVQKNQPKTKEQMEYKAKVIKEMKEKIANGRKIIKTKRLCPTCMQAGINFNYSDCYDEKIDDKIILTICLECGTELILDIELLTPILAKFVVLDEIFQFNKYTMSFDEESILKGVDIKTAYIIYKEKNQEL